MSVKHITGTLYILVTVCMGSATFIEKVHGTAYVSANIYGAWWFCAIWALLTAAAIFYFVKKRIRRASTTAIHLSFVIILFGALLTHLTSHRGKIHLRQNIPADTYTTETAGNTVEEHNLPFTITLDKFETTFHDGTDTPADYTSHLTIGRNDGTRHTCTVSMNNVYSHSGIRLYQSSYDSDGHGSILSVNADPWGLPVTYTGYALLFISMIWLLADPHGTFRRMLKSPMLRKNVLTIAIMAACSATQAVAAPSSASDTPPTIPQPTAEKLGSLYILYNGRICPMQTFSIDFTKKLYGKSSYRGLTAEQVLAGFIFYGEQWNNEPIVKMKSGPLRDRLQLPSFCSVNTFFNRDMGGYILGPYVQEAAMGNTDKFHQNVSDIDARLMLVMELRRGIPLKVFPHTDHGQTTWYGPADKPSASVPQNEWTFIQGAFALLRQYAMEDNYAEMEHAIDKICQYQTINGGSSLPTPLQTKAERIYNAVPFATILFMVNLTLGMLMLVVEMRRLTSQTQPSAAVRLHRAGMVVMCLSAAALTLCEALRWIISHTIPMTNGYETMLFVAWSVMVMSVVAARRFRIALTFGFITSGLFLLVSHIGLMDPDITHVMPVLNSPLLSIHVSVIMISFAMLALTFVCGLTAVAAEGINKLKGGRRQLEAPLEALRLLSRLFLYPALATLSIGIFIGAIWANVSWGQYWGWDPKEVWALITLMVYATAVHTESIPCLRKPLAYHIFMTTAFLTVLMTYFGVNYILGGMHSYA